MEYRIISHVYGARLEELIEQAMQDGWLPQGGIAVHGDMFYQAMIRIGHERIAVKATPQPAVTLG